MNNKGFTLIELLAVVAILGIIMLIAVPSVTSTIESSKKNTFVDSAQALAKIGENYFASNYKNISKPAIGSGLLITISTLYSENYIENVSTLPNSAIVIYNNGGEYEIFVYANNGSYYVPGYRLEDIPANVSVGSMSYDTILTNNCSYTLVGGKLNYASC